MKTKVILAALMAILFNCGGKKEEGTGKNNPPVINEVTLLPQHPTIQTEITAQILSLDKDGNPITYIVKWFVNGKEIGEGMSFKYEEIKKGDKISAEVTPYDNKDYGEPFKTNAITVGGIPPRILSLKITPESLFVTTPQVTVSAIVEDPDMDTVKIFCHWLVNDAVIPDTSNFLNLKSFSLKKNDIITASAVAYDDVSGSEPFPFELHIANSAPVISTRDDSVKCKPESLYYPVPISDPDNDPLTFELLEAPEGVSIDRRNGTIYGNAGDARRIEVMVRATDPDGAYLEARFTLNTP